METDIRINGQHGERVRLLDERIEKELGRHRSAIEDGTAAAQGMGLGILSMLLPAYCNPASRYYRNEALVPVLEGAGDAFLASQHESGSISLANCNIESPPDTAFTSHLAATLAQLAQRFGTPAISGVHARIMLFLERAKPCLLKGGIHTPNHRWVMASALAKMEELFGGTEYRERAFQFLREGLDVTEYGEWTERSNSIYNAICAYYLFTVGKTFGFEPALEASRKTLHMMSYMFHPDDTIATEYSGRQDLNLVAKMDDRYYVAYHLYANHYGDPELAAMARLAERTAPCGALTIIHDMLEPEHMELPAEGGSEAPDSYTILYGEKNTVPVPDDVWYHGPLVKHPHGAAVLRHRRGKLSVTAMAGQPNMLYVQYGEARLLGLKLAAGWFGIGGVAFPGIRQIADDTYRMSIVLKGSYFQPLAEELYKDAGGSYVDMPNELRERSNIVTLELEAEIKLYDDGVDVRVLSGNRKGAYLQAVFMFDPKGKLEGEGIEEGGPHVRRLSRGTAVFTAGTDRIAIEGGAAEHLDSTMRNDPINRDAINLTVNLLTPTDHTIRIRCSEES